MIISWNLCWKSSCDDRSPWSVLTRGGLFIQTNYVPWMSASVSCIIPMNEIRGLTINYIKEMHSAKFWASQRVKIRVRRTFFPFHDRLRNKRWILATKSLWTAKSECEKAKTSDKKAHEERVKRGKMMELRAGEREGKPGKRLKKRGDEKVEKGQTWVRPPCVHVFWDHITEWTDTDRGQEDGCERMRRGQGGGTTKKRKEGGGVQHRQEVVEDVEGERGGEGGHNTTTNTTQQWQKRAQNTQIKP